MTRETKVGLAVASSFIGLVAIVVATKFHANDPNLRRPRWSLRATWPR